jgi:predicted anti-sigma-YlaC factor YlaD
MPASPSPTCDAARAWFSAFRDGEAARDDRHAEHMAGCAACVGYAEALATVTRQVRLRAAEPVDRQGLVAPAVAAFDASPRRQRVGAPRLALGVAGVAGLVVAVLGLLDVSGVYSTAGFHLGWELYSFEAALAVGFLLAAWRPERYRGGLVPVTLAAAILMLVPALGTGVGTHDVLREASHLPVWLGLFALLLAGDPPRRRTAGPTARTEARPA